MVTTYTAACASRSEEIEQEARRFQGYEADYRAAAFRELARFYAAQSDAERDAKNKARCAMLELDNALDVLANAAVAGVSLPLPMRARLIALSMIFTQEQTT